MRGINVNYCKSQICQKGKGGTFKQNKSNTSGYGGWWYEAEDMQ